MRIKILLFGRIRFVVGKKSILITLNSSECDVMELKEIVFQKFPKIKEETFTIALNKEVCQGNFKIIEGDEIAFLPPISGGSSGYLTKNKISKNFIKEVTSFSKENFGSTLTFIGRIRKDRSKKAPKKFIKKVEYTAYEDMAEREIDKILKLAKKNFNLGQLFLRHRIGDVYVGETAFVVVVCSAHRKEGLLAINHIIDEVKNKVPIWKKEVYEDGSINWQDGKLIS